MIWLYNHTSPDRKSSIRIRHWPTYREEGLTSTERNRLRESKHAVMTGKRESNENEYKRTLSTKVFNPLIITHVMYHLSTRSSVGQIKAQCYPVRFRSSLTNEINLVHIQSTVEGEVDWDGTYRMDPSIPLPEHMYFMLMETKSILSKNDEQEEWKTTHVYHQI